MSAIAQIVAAVDGSVPPVQAPEQAIGQAVLIQVVLTDNPIGAVTAWPVPSAYGAPLPGPVSDHLVHHARCPVVVIRDRAVPGDKAA